METENEAVAAEVVDEDPGDRYFRRLAPILQEATERREVGHLVEKITDALAFIAVQYGTGSAGHILASLGEHMQAHEARRLEGVEAGLERSGGRKPH